MKKFKYVYSFFIVLFLMVLFKSGNVQASTNSDYKLGYEYSEDKTMFYLYSPTASKVSVVVDEVGSADFVKSNNIWIGYVPGNLEGKEYSYKIEYEDGIVYENVLDPYGKYLNYSKTRNVIYGDNITFIENWDGVTTLNIKDKNKVIYGLNIENFTSSSTWTGTEENRGKFLGMIEANTRYNNEYTGFDYIKNLGITYIEIPMINSDITPFALDNKYTVGTDSYSSNLEFKQVISSYYASGIGVIVEFDYKKLSTDFINNISKVSSEYINNNQLNLNSESTQRYLKDLLVYLASEFKISGIRIENMCDYPSSYINELTNNLLGVNGQIMIYGDESCAVSINNANIKLVNGSLNYGLVGNLLNKEETGILDGNYSNEIIETLKFSLLSSVDNGEIDYSLVKGVTNKSYWNNTSSYQIINYLGGRNGLSLFDKLYINNLSSTELIKEKVILGFSTMMISGGIPYIYSGDEFLMSYLSSKEADSICTENDAFCFHTEEQYKSLDWSKVYSNSHTIKSLQSLINFRKGDNTIIQTSSVILKNNFKIYINQEQPGVLGYTREYPNAYNRETEKVFVVLNYSHNEYVLTDMTGEGWTGLYNYNASNRDGEKIILNANSLYMEKKIKQPKVNSWVTLILVVGVIGGLYWLNIVLNKRLVEKKGYDINKIKKKYRPFINKNKIKEADKTKEQPEEEKNEEKEKEE